MTQSRLAVWGVIFFCGVIVMLVLGMEILGSAAGTAVLGITAAILTWNRLPRFVQWCLTTWIGMLILDVTTWIVGWKYLPDAAVVKISFVIMHIWFSLYLVHVRYKLRCQYPWQQQRR